VRLDVFPGQQHTFQIAAGRAPEADDAIRKQAEWVRPKLGLASAALAAWRLLGRDPTSVEAFLRRKHAVG
jgi:hypothetical protein